MLVPVRHHIGLGSIVRLADDGDQEIEQNDENDKLINNPDSPNNIDHELTVANALRVIVLVLAPDIDEWRGDVADRVPVSLNIEVTMRQARIITAIEGCAWEFEEHAENDDPGGEEDCEEHYLPIQNAPINILNKCAKVFVASQIVHKLLEA